MNIRGAATNLETSTVSSVVGDPADTAPTINCGKLRWNCGVFGSFVVVRDFSIESARARI